MSKDNKISASKRSREGIQKRVISVAIKERLKDDQIAPPPSDSWAWRKYGQKPIKGSPYPRGYYKCSSSKGCPARKQVERSRVDPTMLLVTYYCQHNHTSPPSRNYHHRTAAAANSTASVSEEELEEEEEEEEEKTIDNVMSSHDHQRLIPENRFTDIGDGPLVNGGEFGWFTDFEYSTSCTMLESTVLTEDDRITMDNEMAMIFEEDDSDHLFADLGELPECSAVFRRGEVAQRRRSLATTTG